MLPLFALIFAANVLLAASPTPAVAIAAQTDPAKLATLKGNRAANPRLQRCVYWLATAEAAGQKPEAVLDEAAKINGTAGTPYAGFVRWGLLENLRIAKELGLLTPENMAEMRRGKSATISQGPHAGEEAEVDHVIPVAVAPELKNQVMNLELLPTKLNSQKSDAVTKRALMFARELHDAGLLSAAGWDAVSTRARIGSRRDNP
jgi:fructose-specific component phosphotransferase system IIB-like protein